MKVQNVIAWVPQTDLTVLGGDADWEYMLQNSDGTLRGTRYLDRETYDQGGDEVHPLLHS
jgi:hypothetical protein